MITGKMDAMTNLNNNKEVENREIEQKSRSTNGKY